MKCWWFAPLLLGWVAGCKGSHREGPATSTSSAASAKAAAAPSASIGTQTLAEARRGFVTKAPDKQPADHAPPTPPPTVFSLVRYPSPAGELWAYVTPKPADGARRPAIVWIAGGFDNGIGDSAWTPTSATNDQSARAFREAGIVLMLPSLRGGSGNPGHRETLFGEVDDVVAAIEHVAKLDYVDPSRVYLGGHSTGGTLALLVAESTQRPRAVFALGPVANVLTYGDALPFDRSNADEGRLRSPMNFTASIRMPTFAIEGANPTSNASSLPFLVRGAGSAPVKTFVVPGVNHFSVISPVSRLVATKILADTGASSNIALTDAELVAAIKAPPKTAP
jgi:acetyl esterase/lipase